MAGGDSEFTVTSKTIIIWWGWGGGIKGTGEARGEAKTDLASSPDATLGYGS